MCANGVLSMFKIYFKNHLEGVRALRVWPWACGPSLTHPAGRWSILILFPNSYYCTCGSSGMWITICRSGVSGKRVTIRPTSPKKGMGTPGWTTFRNLSFSSTSLPRFCHRSAHMLSPFGILHSHLRRRHPTHPHPQKKKKKYNNIPLSSHCRSYLQGEPISITLQPSLPQGGWTAGASCRDRR